MKKDGVQVNQSRNDGDSPLTIAASNGHHTVVNLLLSRGDIQVNQANKHGVTSLLLASYTCNGHVDVVELLLGKEDILVSKADKGGNTPLSVAHERWHSEVEVLLKAKVTKPLNDDQTCIICLDRKPEVVLIPCGHQNMCGACAHQCLEERKKCPLDRTPISPLKKEN